MKSATSSAFVTGDTSDCIPGSRGHAGSPRPAPRRRDPAHARTHATPTPTPTPTPRQDGEERKARAQGEALRRGGDCGGDARARGGRGLGAVDGESRGGDCGCAGTGSGVRGAGSEPRGGRGLRKPRRGRRRRGRSHGDARTRRLRSDQSEAQGGGAWEGGGDSGAPGPVTVRETAGGAGPARGRGLRDAGGGDSAGLRPEGAWP